MLPSSSVVPTSSTTVFWPKGCTKGGICYGWLKPAICVAGVIDDAANIQNSDELSVALSQSEQWKAIQNSCGGNPMFLGICTFEQDGHSPIPMSLTLFGHEEQNISYILYDPHAPNSLRFYVMETPRDSARVVDPIGPRDPYNRLARYDFTRRQCNGIERAIDDVVINQINASALLQCVLNSPSRSSKLLPTTAVLLLSLAAHLGSCSALLLSFSRPRFSLYLTVTSVQQIDVRIEQAIFFITHVPTLNRRNSYDTPTYSVRYTNFFNTVWLMMNDMTLGMACGAFLSENSVTLAAYANTAVQTWLFHLPREAIYWLDAWPAGLKLNAQLSSFYVYTFIGVIDTWDYILPPLTPYLFTTLGTLASTGGLTLLLAVLSDLLSFFLTAHLRIAYELARVVYWAAGIRLGGGLLLGVFRGKRRNVLRNRTDTWSYDIDQLLFGTVLFTLLAFLFPTALVYYVLFAGLRLATLLVQASIETLLAFMHHFPLFALMLRGKDPQRLPGGIYFTLQNQPISLSAIFFQYIELWNRLARHYNPLRLLYQVLAGQHLSSIPGYSIRYAAGPELPKKDQEGSRLGNTM
ncbi:N-acetylglucosaminyl transferase component-domain-containing protein [Pholiota molesta]|nr:N-acetylglucosaminyl transferase component-domain-containing protein [Pholiota molesta]